MTHGSLFSGIGGFDLAAYLAGWTNIFQVEWNAYCQAVLKKNFPDARIYSDIRDFDGTAWRGKVDVISGGFPCQPYSSAGKRLGKEDDRHLWPEMLRVIREAAPRWVVGENVRGLVNWSGGLVFDEVQTDLEAAGYEVGAFVLPAASVNAPHRRDRIWFIAYAYRSGEQMGTSGQSREHGGLAGASAHAASSNDRRVSGEFSTKNGRPWWNDISESGSAGKILDTNANGIGLEGGENKAEGKLTANRNHWSQFPTQPPVCRRNDGVSAGLYRIAALGNAVVPQLVWRIFDAINQFEAKAK